MNVGISKRWFCNSQNEFVFINRECFDDGLGSVVHEESKSGSSHLESER